jgi:transposase-like protein
MRKFDLVCPFCKGRMIEVAEHFNLDVGYINMYSCQACGFTATFRDEVKV